MVTAEARGCLTVSHWFLHNRKPGIRYTPGPQVAGGSAFDPGTLNLTGWWRASYAGSPWTPTASAGPSGSNGNLAEATNPPATGLAVNGHTPADFDGTDDRLVTASANGEVDFYGTTLYATDSYTIIVLFYADAAVAGQGAALYDEAVLWGEQGATGGPILSFSTDGVKGGHFDFATWKSVSVAASTGNWHAAFLRYDNTNIEVGVDSGAVSSITPDPGGYTPSSADVNIGMNYAASKYFDGRIAEIMISSEALDDTARANIISYFNDRYGLAL